MPDSPESPRHARPRTPGAGIRYLLLVVAAAAMVLVDPVASLFVAPPPLPDPAIRATPEIDLLARFAIGARALAPSVSLGQIADQLETSGETGNTPTDRDERIAAIAARMRSAIAMGEAGDPALVAGRLMELRQPVADLDPPNPDLTADLATVIRAYTEGTTTIDTADRDRLIERHGVTARIALAHDLPDTDPERGALIRSSTRLIIALVVFAAVATLGFIVGCVLLITGIALRGTGRLPMRFVPDRGSDARTHNAFLETGIVFLASFAAFKALLIAASAAFPDAEGALGIAQFVGQWMLALVVLWPLVRGVDRSTVAQSMGWMRGRGVAREMVAGVAVYLAFLPVVVGGFAVMILMINLFGARPSHPAVDYLTGASPIHLLLIFSIASIWAPVVEESVFRGAMYHHARRFVGIAISALFTAFVFAAIHPQGIAGIPPLMALAVGFAVCREWRGSLIGSMTAHALHNTVIMSLAFFVLGG